MSRRLAACVPCLAALLAWLPTAAPSRACAPVMERGAHVGIATETALIVWDGKAKRQHFIRRASFDTKVPYFGFLVPTPTRPELAEAPDDLFSLAEDWTRPEVKVETLYRMNTLLPMMAAGVDAEPKSALAGGVAVLDRQRVGGFDAVVLKADDPEALRQWLEKHGYDARPALITWLAPYVKGGWILTAFQIAKDEAASGGVTTQAVRMSFSADRPFFPYSEPPDEKEKPAYGTGRFLRVFFVADQRMQGAFDDPEKKWGGKAAWAGVLGDKVQHLQHHLDAKAVPLPEGSWLTVFDDPAPSRLGDPDVFFSPASDQSELRRPPIIHYETVYYPGPDYIVLGALGVVVGLLVVWRVWKAFG